MTADGISGNLPDVGLYVDDERSIAAVSRPAPANPSLHIASLHHTVLYVHADGSASLGGSTDPNAAEFVGYVAEEPTSGFEPGDLVAMTFRCLLAEVAHSLETDPSSLATAASFPSTWDAEQVSAVRVAMNRLGLSHVALVPEAEALAQWAESTQATWAGSDSGIAAARGAAGLASHYPVDAVTETIAVSKPARPLWMRTPVLAAAAFAAVLALGASVTALVSQNYSTTQIPEIESAPIAATTTTATAPAASAPFPTVVPIVEAVPLPASAVTASPTVVPIPTSDPPPTELPSTTPATSTPDETTPDVTEDPSVVEEPPVVEDPSDPIEDPTNTDEDDTAETPVDTTDEEIPTLQTGG